MSNCPICEGNYTMIELCGNVCDAHQNQGWIVTTCPDCGIPRFSQTKGVCDRCLAKSPKQKGFGFSKNRRMGLISKGLGCKDNG